MSSHVFGPVPSRRLGRSLGVDLVPYKTCSYDCIYCQLGRTTLKTVERKEWIPLSDIIAELKKKLDAKPDYITLSGSGEPTLYSRLDELIEEIRSLTSIPVAVLTNGSLLWQEEVRKQIANARLVLPSLDGGDSVMFNAVNRPHPEIGFQKMLDGLCAFREEYAGEIWLEVFLLAGHTTVDAEAEKLARCAKLIRPDRVQLNTATRPAAEDWAVAVTPKRMKELAALFPKAEVIADFRGVHQDEYFQAGRDEIMQMLMRRPCTTGDIADGLLMHKNEVLKYIEELTAQGRLTHTLVGGKTLYFLKAPNVESERTSQ